MFVSEEPFKGQVLGLNHDDWWKGAVVYQIYPRSFQDSNGDGYGDLEGIRSRLDYLQELGVDVLWLSPIYRSPQADNGYDICDYQDIDPIFGTLEDFDNLIRDVHARGMKLIMDLVVNHSSDEHPWFIESRSSIDNPKRDWYYWRQARPDLHAGTPGAEPNNWESFFSGSAWEYDEITGEYYLHLFHKKQPDLNWENPDVRRAIYTMMNWWLDRGVDGFRMDVINFISKDPALPDGQVLPKHHYGDGFPFYSEGPRLHEFLAEMHREVFDGRGGIENGRDVPMTVGETPGVRTDNIVLFTDADRRELDMVFQFAHVDLGLEEGKFRARPLRPGELADSLDEWQQAQAERGWNSLYLNNHDQPRAVSRFGDESLRYESATALATVLHFLRGTPYIYQGEELGMTNSAFSSMDDFRDVESLRYYREAIKRGEDEDSVLLGLRAMGRDNARTPVQWEADLPTAGFTTGMPWISVNPNCAQINAADQINDPSSVYSYYRQLIRFRHHLPTVALGTYERLESDSAEVYAYRRAFADSQVVVVANLSSVCVKPSIYLEDTAGLLQILGNIGVAHQFDQILEPWEARVYVGRGDPSTV
ncbi:alpha-glucosidase [Schaalia vaccimaxillae]|uniref:alpha-glucosidase n=1 Tax=Schaalia vaccimaxillae TaxID=183916 RepID=UPI0003B69BBE|nr:alpha-glucosidase [Schaalia vaccimaxillae]